MICYNPAVRGPMIRLGGDMPDRVLMDALRRKEMAKESMMKRFRGKPDFKRYVYPQPSFIDVLATQVAAGSSFGTYTTAKTVINTNSLCTVAPNYWTVGRCLEIEVMGAMGTLVTTPGTCTMQVMLGPVATMIIVFTSGAMQLNATAHTALPFWFKALLTCRATGSGTSANFMGQAWIMGTMFTVTAGQVDGVNSHTIMAAPKTAPAVGTGFDSTVHTQLDFWNGFSISDAANTIRVDQYKALSWA